MHQYTKLVYFYQRLIKNFLLKEKIINDKVIKATIKVSKSNAITISVPAKVKKHVAITGVNNVVIELVKDFIPLTFW